MKGVRLCRQFLVLFAGTALLAAPLGLAFGGCGLFELAQGVDELANEIEEHNVDEARRVSTAPPESSWNSRGWWRRISSSPPTYIPKGHSSRAPRTEATGTWFVDQRDGKRLFVPNLIKGRKGLDLHEAYLTSAKAATIPPKRHPYFFPPIRNEDWEAGQ